MSQTQRSDERRIREEAAEWLVAHGEARRSETGQARFEAWLAADPRHFDAYERVTHTLYEVGELDLAPALSAESENASPQRAGKVVRWRRPVVWSGALAAAAAVVFAIVLAPNLVPSPAPDFATETAQIAPVTLEDGSIVTLSALSSIDADFSDTARREVTLRSGQAFFEVAPNVERPFYVMAGDVAVRVVGTKFDVRRGPAQTIISVREGTVEVAAGDGAPRVLHAGDQAIVEHRTSFFVSRPAATEVATIPTANVAAWREGRLTYYDTPLSELVADLNRYYAPGIELQSAAAGEVRVTASFRSDEIEIFLDDLSRGFPVATERSAGGRYRIDTAS